MAEPGWRRWVFRALAFVGVPLAILASLELGLRLAGVGYPTGFLLGAGHNGQKVFTQNNRFGWRFFGPRLSRTPRSFTLAQAKPPDTFRVLVFGESAAFGDPQPEYGLPRMLQALLELHYPGVPFEVINAAMTGINSHAVLPIARDCAKARADIWVLYVGNNEVVGPFGAGTVFGPQVPPLGVIRGSLALKTTRLGQLVDEGLGRLRRGPIDSSEWGGMAMFVGHPVPADAPVLRAVYSHFERNLTDILQTARACGAAVVVSTVAVNLRDCAPFASGHRPGLSKADQERWEGLYREAVAGQEAGKPAEALPSLRKAAAIDDAVAELHYRWGICAMALNDGEEAGRQLRLARDLDTLRFRCDSRLNGTIRRLAAGREAERIRLADAEDALARRSLNGLPGGEFFYDHVHLTFEGNFLLARVIAEQVVAFLPPNARARARADWPSSAECAQRLAWAGWTRYAAVADMLGRLNDAPFSQQANQQEQVLRFTDLLQ